MLCASVIYHPTTQANCSKVKAKVALGAKHSFFPVAGLARYLSTFTGTNYGGKGKVRVLHKKENYFDPFY